MFAFSSYPLIHRAPHIHIALFPMLLQLYKRELRTYSFQQMDIDKMH